MSDLEHFRKNKDNLFAKEQESPLTPEQKQNFQGLKYFEPNSELLFHNLPLEKPEGEHLAQIKTSAGDTEPYKQLGKIHFVLRDTTCELTLYESVNNKNVFLAFKDITNASETYHEGRYLEVAIEDGKVVELDFNYSYNPYCAYNDKWRCPITPEENTLTVEIKAGEKRFH